MFFDEAQRYGENEYEWLRDVHDHLARINIRLFAFLIGQQGLRAVKTAFEQENKTQIVAVEVAVSVVASAFAILRRALRDGIETADGSRPMHARLRFCTNCMKLGYHGVMHQRAGATTGSPSWRRPGRVLPQLRRVGRVPAQRARPECALPMCDLPPTLVGFGPKLRATTCTGRSTEGDLALALQGLMSGAREPIRQPRHR